MLRPSAGGPAGMATFTSKYDFHLFYGRGASGVGSVWVGMFLFHTVNSEGSHRIVVLVGVVVAYAGAVAELAITSRPREYFLITIGVSACGGGSPTG